MADAFSAFLPKICAKWPVFTVSIPSAEALIEGRNEEVIQKCIRDQGKEDEKLEQLKLMQGMECLSIGAKEVGLR